MKKTAVCIASIWLALSGNAALAAPPIVNPEQMDMDTDITAKIGKEKSRKSSMAHAMKSPKGANGSGSADCGVVNINSNDQKSNSGVKEMFGKQSTTIVTGPVINMANCK